MTTTLTDDNAVTVSFTTVDPGLAVVIAVLRDLPEYCPQRHEAEATLYEALARRARASANRMRELAARQPA